MATIALALTMPFAMAANERGILPVTVAPQDGQGQLSPNTTFSYQFVFASSTACTSLLNISTNITTDARGIGAVQLNISTLAQTPAYLCEYRGGTLRATHPLFSSMFEGKSSQAEVLALGFNTTAQLDVRYDARYSTLTLAQVNANSGNWSQDKPLYNTTAQLGSIFCHGNGTNCQTGTTYTNGTGLLLAGNQFNISVAYLDTLYAPISVTGDNSSWNQTHANSLYAPISSAANSSWNQTHANSLYLATGSTAANSNQLGGQAPTYYLNTTGGYATMAQAVANIGNWSADRASYNTTAQLGLLFCYGNGTNCQAGFTISQIAANIGNWSADKASYATLIHVNDINTSANMQLLGFNTTAQLDTRYNSLNLAQLAANIGNWSADKSALSNLTYAQLAANIGNFSADGYSKTYIDTLGNASEHVANCAAGTVLQNITATGVQCVVDQTGGAVDGTGGWTNSSTNTTTDLELIVNNTIRAYGGAEVLSTQQYFCDFLPTAATTMCYPDYLGAAVSTGTIAAVNGNISRPGVIRMSDTTAANSGYRYMTDITAFRLNGSEEFKAAMAFEALTFSNNSLTRIGFLDTTTSTAPVDGVYFEVINTSVGCVARNNNVVNLSVTNYTITTATGAHTKENAWYGFKVTIGSNGTWANCRIFNASGGAQGQLLYDQNITRGIPAAPGRETGAGIITLGTTAGTATIIAYIDFIMTSIETNRRGLW